MTFSPKSATALALVLVLAACGGGAEEADETATVTTDGGAATAPAATPASGATPAPDASPAAAASPTPTPTPTASTAAAPAAAVAEPAAFAVCKACHSVEPGENGLGPSLAGIWGEKAGAVPGFEFSDAMKEPGIVWNQATLDRYLENPREMVPGTKMAFGGVKDDAKRQAIIDYIKGL